MLARYGDYGDAILGRFGVKEDGNRIPNVRAVIKPLIGLFYGEAGGRRWRNAIDQALLKKPDTVSEVIHVRFLFSANLVSGFCQHAVSKTSCLQVRPLVVWLCIAKPADHLSVNVKSRTQLLHALLQEAMKVVPECVLDAPPPQLEALPDFTLPEALPQPHGALASSGLQLVAEAAVLISVRREPGVANSEAGLTGQHEPSTAPRALDATMATGKLSPMMQQGAGFAAVADGSVGGAAGPAETKRMCLKSDADSATAAAQQSGTAGESLEVDASAEPLPQATSHLMTADQCLKTEPERAEGQHAFVQQRRQLVSA